MSYTSSCKTKMFQTHPLDLHEIRCRIACSLSLKDLASCARVSQYWNDSFTPPLYNSVVFSKHDLSMEFVERNKHLIKHLMNQDIRRIRKQLTLITFNLTNNSIRDDGAEALSEALKINSTLTTLNLNDNSIGENGAEALSEALNDNSTFTTLDLDSNWIGENGAVALSKACSANSTVTIKGIVFQRLSMP
ncbi:hypothetical protein BKA57DRAFT_495529 [Linnemannia elongata]|nr:hypothetical protein BKA57DRAFT_495529 [Linnemannia elongata]